MSRRIFVFAAAGLLLSFGIRADLLAQCEPETGRFCGPKVDSQAVSAKKTVENLMEGAANAAQTPAVQLPSPAPVAQAPQVEALCTTRVTFPCNDAFGAKEKEERRQQLLAELGHRLRLGTDLSQDMNHRMEDLGGAVKLADGMDIGSVVAFSLGFGVGLPGFILTIVGAQPLGAILALSGAVFLLGAWLLEKFGKPAAQDKLEEARNQHQLATNNYSQNEMRIGELRRELAETQPQNAAPAAAGGAEPVQ